MSVESAHETGERGLFMNEWETRKIYYHFTHSPDLASTLS